MDRELVITIDGPAGAGKSTVARAVARRLGYLYVDTGAMYRGVALLALRSDIAPDDADALSALVRDVEIELKTAADGTRVFLNGVDVTSDIREPRVGSIVSQVAKNPQVRTQLVVQQRRLAQRGGVVLEGRDTGSHVMPAADRKFFLTARFEERVNRRWRELRRHGHEVTRDEVAEEIAARDRTDSTRSLAPLVRPPGAISIDTTELDVPTVVRRILAACSESKAGR